MHIISPFSVARAKADIRYTLVEEKATTLAKFLNIRYN